MKVIVHYNDKTKNITVEQVELKELIQKVCIFFSITAFSDYVLATIPNGTVIDKSNLHFITDGCELMLKFVGGSGRSSPVPSASFIRADRSNRSGVQNSFFTSHSGTPPTSPPPSATGISHTHTHTPTMLASPLLVPSSSPINIAAANNTAVPSPSNANGNASSSPQPGSTGASSPPPAVSPPSATSSSAGTSSPQMQTIDSIFSSLNDLSLKKKALFDLKELLKDENNVKRFIEKDGIRAIEDQMSELSGNTLAYALIAIQSACSFDIGVHALPGTLVNRVLAMIADSTVIPSITKTGLSILTQYCQSIPMATSQLTNQYTKVALASQYPSLLANIVALLSSSTVDIQLNALTLINVMLTKSSEQSSLINRLDEYDINLKLKKLFESNVSQELKKQLYYYQKHKLSILKKKKNIPYNKESEDHEALLMKLWTTTYPDVKLETRVGAQWKLMGFQGTDPATDFRGMGMLGLENLVYIAEHHTDQFRKLISGQVERKERDYPTATAGINLTQLFFELFKITEENNPDFPIFPILFSHKNAFEEVYCIAFQLLDITWDTMNASYMEFPKVLASVKQSIVTALETKPSSLEAFNWAAGASKKTNAFQNEDESMESEDIKKLKNIVQTDILDILKTQKINLLNDGIYFRLQKPVGKSKTVTLTHLFVYQSSTAQTNGEILYALCTEPVNPLSPTSTPQSQTPQAPMSPVSSRSELTGSGGMLDKSNSTGNSTTPTSPNLAGTSNLNSSTGINTSNNDLHRAAMTFTSCKINDVHFPAQTTTPVDQQKNRKPDNKNPHQQQQQYFFTVNFGREIVELVTTNKEDHSNFVDAIRIRNNKEIDCPETIEEYKTLVNLSMKLKLLDLEGIELPKTAPKVPPPPPDFFFLSKESISSPSNSFINFSKS